MKHIAQIRKEFLKLSNESTDVIEKFLVDHAHDAIKKIPELAKQLGMKEEDVVQRAFELAAEHIEKHLQK